jgi:metallo-beta-lactamase family protein
MKIQFCGAAREVTGSCHLLTLDNGFKILLDCGMYQGGSAEMRDFNDKWLFNPSEIDCLVVSHAHIDHTGRIPKLVKDGFRGQIHATHATRDLCAIMLLDSAKIQESDAERDNKHKKEGDEEEMPFYQIEDVKKTLELFQSYNYEQTFRVSPNVRVVFRDAGHILGSASVTLEVEEYGKTTRIAFTGDIGRPKRPILADPKQMPPADFIICESTYGDREHESAPSEIDHFAQIVHQTCVENRGKLLIPAFAVGRTQEIVFILDQLAGQGKLPRVPVYIDSPLAINATDIFIHHPECFDEKLTRYMIEDPNPFGFKNLQYVRTTEESKALNSSDEPAIIIASSGMMNAGRIRHHVFNNMENPKNTILIVGYCSPNTPGGELRAGATSLFLFGEEKQVKCKVEIMDSFSAHGDRNEMFDMIANQMERTKAVFLVHGTLDRQEKWSEFLKEKGFKYVAIPEFGEVVEL